jgi:hypothetical protein
MSGYRKGVSQRSAIRFWRTPIAYLSIICVVRWSVMLLARRLTQLLSVSQLILQVWRWLSPVPVARVGVNK